MSESVSIVTYRKGMDPAALRIEQDSHTCGRAKSEANTCAARNPPVYACLSHSHHPGQG